MENNKEKKKYNSIHLGLAFLMGVILYHLIISFFK